jgi:hypothetical protein
MPTSSATHRNASDTKIEVTPTDPPGQRAGRICAPGHGVAEAGGHVEQLGEPPPIQTSPGLGCTIAAADVR